MNPQEIAGKADELIGKEVIVEGILYLGETDEDLSFIAGKRQPYPVLSETVLVEFAAFPNRTYFTQIRYETLDAEMPTIHYPINIRGKIVQAHNARFRVALEDISELVIYFNGRVIFIKSAGLDLAQFDFHDPRNVCDLDWFLDGVSTDQLPLVKTADVLDTPQNYLYQKVRLRGEIIGDIRGERNNEPIPVWGMWIPKPKEPSPTIQLPLLTDRYWYFALTDNYDNRIAPGAHNCICINFRPITDAIARMKYWARIGGPFYIMDNACVLGRITSSVISPFVLEIEPVAIAIQPSVPKDGSVIHLWSSEIMQP